MTVSLDIHRKSLVIIGVIFALLILFLFINVKAGESYRTCDEIYAATGRKSIPKGDKLYNPAMDREIVNHKETGDGFSCE